MYVHVLAKRWLDLRIRKKAVEPPKVMLFINVSMQNQWNAKAANYSDESGLKDQRDSRKGRERPEQWKRERNEPIMNFPNKEC
jgi:hypothetical protein